MRERPACADRETACDRDGGEIGNKSRRRSEPGRPPLAASAVAATKGLGDQLADRDTGANPESRDYRIALHEAAHLTAGRCLGALFGGATIDADPALGFSGRCWGPDFELRFASEEDRSRFVAQIDMLMPEDGESHAENIAYAHCLCSITQLSAGSEAERIHLGVARPATDDRKQERQLAALICSSEESCSALIAACTAEARAILRRHEHVLMALVEALLEHRTLNAEQIDQVIARAAAAKALSEEHERRRSWQRTIEGAATFRPES